jgi:hypothetical protein
MYSLLPVIFGYFIMLVDEVNAALHSCPLSEFCDRNNNVTCSNFSNIGVLDKSIQDSVKTDVDRHACDSYISTDGLKITLNAYSCKEQPLLNDQLDLYSLFLAFKSPDDFWLTFLNFRGIDLNATAVPSRNYKSLERLRNIRMDIDLEVRRAGIGLYYNGDLIKMSSDGGRTCDETQLLEIFKTSNSTIFSLKASLSLSNMKYPRKWCPLAFNQAHIHKLGIRFQPIRFFQENTLSSADFDCDITYLLIDSMVIEHLNREVLHASIRQNGNNHPAFTAIQ